MKTCIRLASVLLLWTAAGPACFAQEKPPTATGPASKPGDEIASPDAQAAPPETVRQGLTKAIEVTKALVPRAVTIERSKAMPILPADFGGRGDLKSMLVPQHRDVTPYLSSRPWVMGEILDRDFGAYGRLPDWPLVADAGALAKLLKDADPAIRGLAAEALAVLERPEDIPAVAELLADDRDALPALIRLRSARAVGFQGLIVFHSTSPSNRRTRPP